jgi:hypothetical protein
VIDLVNKTHDACLDWAGDLRFNKDFQADGCVICLYGRLIELAGCFHVIFSSERFSGCGIMFRSFLECHVDLDNCLNDENYLKYILAALFENIRKKLKASKSNNPFLAEISKIENKAEQFDEANVELTKLKNEGF